MVKYKEFKINDILEWQQQKEIDPLKIPKLTINKNVLYPFYGQAIDNNGIISYLSLNDNVLNNKLGKPTILIHSNNQNIVYLETPFYLKDGHGATSVLQAEFLNKKIALYIITSIKKVISKKFSYNDKATKIALKNTFIKLPINDDNTLNFQFMENYIDELEKENIKRLNQYLIENNLENYELTKEVKDILNKKIIYKNFKIGDLFNIHPTKSYGYTNTKLFETKGNTPVVVNSSQNNGIGGYVNLKPTEKGNIITFSDTTTSNAIFYQPNDFIGYSHVQGLYPKNNITWNQKSLLYIVVLFKKNASNRFDYSNKFTRKIASNMILKLPIKQNGEIDLEYMENFITVQQKLAIKNLVDWINKQQI